VSAIDYCPTCGAHIDGDTGRIPGTDHCTDCGPSCEGCGESVAYADLDEHGHCAECTPEYSSQHIMENVTR
jgi:hypothetical protein